MRIRNPLLRHGLIGDARAEGDAARRPPTHPFEGALGQPDQPHAVVDATRPEPALRDLEAAPFAEQYVGDRHPGIVEDHLGMAVRGLVIAEDRQHALDNDTRMRRRHQDHRLPPVAVRVVGVRLAITISTLQRGSSAPEVHHLRPLMT